MCRLFNLYALNVMMTTYGYCIYIYIFDNFNYKV